MLRENEIAVGIKQEAGLFQVWHSLTGREVTCLTIHRKREDAEQALALFITAAQAGHLTNVWHARVLKKKMALISDAPALPFSNETQEEVARLIHERNPSVFFFELPPSAS